MLDRLGDLASVTVRGISGEDLGTVVDFYFDDERWTIRYVVVDTGNWLNQRHVLVSPFAIDVVDRDAARIVVDLSRQQLRNAPRADLKRPISRDFEIAYAGYHGYVLYWAGPGVWGSGATPRSSAPSDSSAARAMPTASSAPAIEADSHIRSCADVRGYHIEALDGEIGHVEEFLADDESWTIRYLIVDTSNWIGGRTVLVSPGWARSVDWGRRRVHVDLSHEQIKSSPDYHSAMTPDRDYEDRLHAHYRQPAYWVPP